MRSSTTATKKSMERNEISKPLKKEKGKLNFFKSKKTSKDELEEFSLFIRMFGFLIRDGYTPDKAVAMITSTTKGGLGNAAREALLKMEQGASMSDAFSFSGYFPKEFCAVVGVGESTGSLGEALDLYAEYIEKVLQMRKGFNSALTYPTMLLSFVIVMAAVMLFVVAPKFVDMLNQMGASRDKLPSISNVLFVSYDFANIVGMPIIVSIVVAIAYYLMFGKGKTHIMKILGVVPKIRDVNNKLNWSQWLMMGAICLKAGMLLNPMLGILANLPLPLELGKKNKARTTAYEVVRKNVLAGNPLSQELEGAKVPHIVTQMIGASEKSGRMGEAMKSVAGQYLYSLSMDIKSIGTVVEQIAIGVVVMFGGSIVAVVAITMMSVSTAGM